MHNVHRIILTALITIGLASAACAGPTEKITITIDKTVDHVIDSAKPSKKPGKTMQAPSGDMDAHFIKADEYFASPETLTPEVMGALTVAIEVGRSFIAEAGAALDEVSQ